jgi:ABC-type bacteriocin/lantibiotic exporter with double-glycine peptidase domain/CRP-like cAMP-binding protein
LDQARSVLDQLPLLEFLSPDARQLVADSFVPCSLGFGAAIVREGDPADAYYVLVSGRARVVKSAGNGEEIALNVLRPGDGFGEMGLLQETPRNATVRASEDVELLRLDRSIFQALVQHHPEIRAGLELQLKHRHLHNFLRVHSAFARLPTAALTMMLNDLEPVSIREGELVIREGDAAGPMYVVEEGRLRVFNLEDGKRAYRAYLRQGDFFGEMSLFKGVPRTAGVEAVSACRLLRLPSATFAKLLESYPDFKRRLEERIAQYDYKNVARVPLDFAEEMLPAAAQVQEKVGPDQVDPDSAGWRGARAEGRGTGDETSPHPSTLAPRPSPLASRHFPHVYQIDEMDCGAACLAMVCRHFGRSVSLALIRKLVYTSADGTSLRGLCRAAAELGLAARAVRAAPQDLEQMPLPAIVHWQGNHWVVLYGVHKTHLRIADPAIGLRRLPRPEFEARWTGYAALYDYTTDFEKAPQSKPSLAWMVPFFRPFSRVLAKALMLAVLVGVLLLVLPVAAQMIVDTVVVEKDTGLLHVLMAAMGSVLVLMTVALVVQRYLLSLVALRIDAATLDFLTRKLLALPLSYFLTRRTADIQRRLEGVQRVREFLVQSGVRGLTAAAQLVAAIGLMVHYSPLLTLVFLVAAPFYGLVMWFSQRRLRPILHTLLEAVGQAHSCQVDAIKGIETVKALGGENAVREKLLNEFLGIARHEFRSNFTILCFQAASQLLNCLTVMLLLWFGAYQVMDGKLTIGGLVAYSALVALANGALGTLLPLGNALQGVTVVLNRLHDIFEQEPEQGADHARLMAVPALEGRIRLHNLGFQYGGPEAPKVLAGISIEVPAGKKVAIVGRSGAGKTTLAKCLAGLLEPTEGTIYYDGMDGKTLNHGDLRRQIGLVVQDSFLFADSIARNIAFADVTPDMDRVVWAARLANAQEFIDRLPLGYDTKVGESGMGLSAGQRQRLALARAIYHRPAVLILDETTSSLDVESERLVLENLDRLLRGRTAFVVAQRLSTIQSADLILVLEKGRLVEHGNHDELMERQGLYYYLSSQQLVDTSRR